MPKLDWHAALARGETLLAEQGALHGFKPGEAQQLNYDSGSRRYWYRAQSDRFFPEDTSASIYFDADSGAYQSSWGTYSDGKFMTVENWLLALHMVNDPVDYLPYRIFVVVRRPHHRRALRHRRLYLVEKAQGAHSRQFPRGVSDRAAYFTNVKIQPAPAHDEIASTCVHFGERSLT